MTELELRQRVVNIVNGWKGATRGSATHLEILALYNNYKPLARGYKVQVKDAWCATTVSAAFIKAGIAQYTGTECSCNEFIRIAKTKGYWVEEDDHMPKIGDCILYAWSDKANYASYDNKDSANHIGIVVSITGNSFLVVEGNMSSASKVGTRPVPRNGRYIRGFICPNYAAIAAELSKSEKPVATYIVGKTNADTMFNFCTQVLGMTKAGACGVLANVESESSFRPNLVGDNGTSYGICQWHASRFTNLKNWCAKNGKDYTTLDGQLWFLKYELETSYTAVLNAIKGVPNTAEGAYSAGYTWCKKFEIPADTENRSKIRGNLARNTYWPRYGGETKERPYVYTVRSGDTLSKIANSLGVTVAELAKWNNIANVNVINVGQELFTSEAAAAVGKLAKLGIINSPDYWQTAVASGKVKWLDALVTKAANKITKAGTRCTSVNAAVDRLVKGGVIENPNYWKAHQGDYPSLNHLLMALGGCV